MAITTVINLILTISLEFLNRGVELELFANHELYMVFNYIRYTYQMLLHNRRPLIIGMNEDFAKLGLIDLSDLSSSGDKFHARRKKASFA